MTTEISFLSLREVAKRYIENGWMPIYGSAVSKAPWTKWTQLYDGTQEICDVWRNCPNDCEALALVLGSEVVVVDFDCHDSHRPNGLDAYEKIKKRFPRIFEGAITEQTQSGGYHIYYRAPGDPSWRHTHKKEYITCFLCGPNENIPVYVEVKMGKRLSWCYPSRKNGKIAYTLEGPGFAELRPEMLAELPRVFRYDINELKEKPEQKANTSPKNGQSLDFNELPADIKEAAIELFVEMYADNANSKGRMHYGAFALAANMAALGYSDDDRNTALIGYEKQGHRHFRPGELEDILKDSSEATSSAIPWRKIKQLLENSKE